MIRQLQYSQVCFKFRRLLAKVAITADDIASVDFIFIESFNLELNVLTSQSIRQSFVSGIVDLFDGEMNSSRKKGDNLVFKGDFS